MYGHPFSKMMGGGSLKAVKYLHTTSSRSNFISNIRFLGSSSKQKEHDDTVPAWARGYQVSV